MPVDTEHTAYIENLEKWQRLNDVLSEDAIKKAGEIYLPPIDKEIYANYLQRAMFTPFVARTSQYLVGALFRRNPALPGASDKILKSLESVTVDGKSALLAAYEIARQTILIGRIGVLVDSPTKSEDGEPYIALYPAKSIINWRSNIQDGLEKLTLVVLREIVSVPDPADPFVTQEIKQIRVLKINESGNYVQELWQQGVTNKKSSTKSKDADYVLQSTITPLVAGRPRKKLPFYFKNVDSTSSEISDSLLLPMANINLAHYRNSADYEHGIHYAGLPTPYMCGFEQAEEKMPYTIGTTRPWIAQDPNAKVGFLEVSGPCFDHIKQAMKDKEAQMAVMGARMIETTKAAVESSDTIATRYAGEHSILTTLGKSLSNFLTAVFTELLEWRGIKVESFKYQLNDDFLDGKLPADQLRAIMQAWQAGSLSWDTLFYNYKRGEIYPENVNMEDERAKVEKESPINSIYTKFLAQYNSNNAGRAAGVSVGTGDASPTKKSMASEEDTEEGKDDENENPKEMLPVENSLPKKRKTRTARK